jgi:hypothetical protein
VKLDVLKCPWPLSPKTTWPSEPARSTDCRQSCLGGRGLSHGRARARCLLQPIDRAPSEAPQCVPPPLLTDAFVLQFEWPRRSVFFKWPRSRSPSSSVGRRKIDVNDALLPDSVAGRDTSHIGLSIRCPKFSTEDIHRLIHTTPVSAQTAILDISTVVEACRTSIGERRALGLLRGIQL